MITPIAFCGNKQQKPQYKDPLNTPIIQAASYSSELGTAISEIAPRLGAALWAPSLMYIGADIYDKYKNDQNEFNPSAKRALERAIYQGVFNLICLPAMIFLGQKAVSPFAILTKDGISTDAKDIIFRHTKEVIDQCEGENFGDAEMFKKVLRHSLKNKIKASKAAKTSGNFIQKVFKFCHDRYTLADNNPRKLLEYASKNADKLFVIKNALLAGEHDKVPDLVRKKYEKAIPQLKAIYETDNTNSALKTALKEYQNMNIFQNKILKTVGGFIPIIFLAGPVGNFLDKIIIKKYLNQGIDEITQGFVHNTYMKKIFTEMDKANTEKAQAEKSMQ